MLASFITTILLALLLGVSTCVLAYRNKLDLDLPPRWWQWALPLTVLVGAMLLHILLTPTAHLGGLAWTVASLVLVLLLLGATLVLALWLIQLPEPSGVMRWPGYVGMALVPCAVGLAAAFAVGSGEPWGVALGCGLAAWLGASLPLLLVGYLTSFTPYPGSGEELMARYLATLAVLVGFGPAALGAVLGWLLHLGLLGAVATSMTRGGVALLVLLVVMGLLLMGVVGAGMGLWRRRQRSQPPLQRGATLLTCRGHRARVTAVAWSPDGQRLASGSLDKTVQVWDATSGRNLLLYRGYAATGGRAVPFRGYAAAVTAVVWSPDGQRLVWGGGDGTAQVIDAAAGHVVLTYRGHGPGPVYALAYAPDGRYLASAGRDGTMQVWHASTGETVYTYRDRYPLPPRASYPPMHAVAWSPGGQSLA